VLSGYRLKERVPDNVGELTVPLGVPEVIREGSDVTLVTYGALCRIAQEAAEDLVDAGIRTEVVDVQTLLPFDVNRSIVRSVAKTGALVVVVGEFRRDERHMLLGEDVGVRGGVFRVSDGFIEEFGADRIIDTPVAESSIVGIAIGAAIGGLRPVAEMQFADFHAPAF